MTSQINVRPVTDAVILVCSHLLEGLSYDIILRLPSHECFLGLAGTEIAGDDRRIFAFLAEYVSSCRGISNVESLVMSLNKVKHLVSYFFPSVTAHC